MSSIISSGDPDRALLEEGLSKLGVSGGNEDGSNFPPEQILNLLIQYIEEIERFNPAYGLVKVKDRRELIVKHILDSLAPAGIFSSRPVKRIADIGSGAGLPGIPLAICMPGAEFTLVESMGRRAGFLRDALAVLKLPNAVVVEEDLKTFSRHVAETGPFDLVVFRAFKPLENRLLRLLFRLLAPGGIIAAYKGRRQTVEEEMSGLTWKPLSWDLLPLSVPFLEEERHLLLIHAPAE